MAPDVKSTHICSWLADSGRTALFQVLTAMAVCALTHSPPEISGYASSKASARARMLRLEWTRRGGMAAICSSWLIAATRRNVCSEVPPIAKKDAVTLTLTGERPSNSPQMRCSLVSSAVAGAVCSSARSSHSGSGSAFMSILPLGSSGKASRGMTTVGTMAATSCLLQWLLTARGSTVAGVT